MPHTVPRSAVFLRPPRRAGVGGGGRTRGALRTRVGAAPAGRVARRRRRRGNAGWLDRRTAGIEGSGPGVAAVEPVPGCSVASEWRIAPVSRNATQHRRGDGTARGPASGPGDGTAHGSATEPGDGTAPRFGDPARATAPVSRAGPAPPGRRRPAAPAGAPLQCRSFTRRPAPPGRRRPAAPAGAPLQCRCFTRRVRPGPASRGPACPRAAALSGARNPPARPRAGRRRAPPARGPSAGATA